MLRPEDSRLFPYYISISQLENTLSKSNLRLVGPVE